MGDIIADTTYTQRIPGWPCYSKTETDTSMQSRLAVCGEIIYLPYKDYYNFPTVNAFGIARVGDEKQKSEDNFLHSVNEKGQNRIPQGVPDSFSFAFVLSQDGDVGIAHNIVEDSHISTFSIAAATAHVTVVATQDTPRLTREYPPSPSSTIHFTGLNSSVEQKLSPQNSDQRSPKRNDPDLNGHHDDGTSTTRSYPTKGTTMAPSPFAHAPSLSEDQRVPHNPPPIQAHFLRRVHIPGEVQCEHVSVITSRAGIFAHELNSLVNEDSSPLTCSLLCMITLLAGNACQQSLFIRRQTHERRR